MQSFDYYKLRAGGLGIIMGLSAAWGAVVGLLWAMTNKEWPLIAGCALWGAFVAFVHGTPIGRWIARSLSSWPAVAFAFVTLVLPHYVLVLPAKKFAIARGWIVEEAAT